MFSRGVLHKIWWLSVSRLVDQRVINHSCRVVASLVLHGCLMIWSRSSTRIPRLYTYIHIYIYMLVHARMYIHLSGNMPLSPCCYRFVFTIVRWKRSRLVPADTRSNPFHQGDIPLNMLGSLTWLWDVSPSTDLLWLAMVVMNQRNLENVRSGAWWMLVEYNKHVLKSRGRVLWLFVNYSRSLKQRVEENMFFSIRSDVAVQCVGQEITCIVWMSEDFSWNNWMRIKRSIFS